jgi:hypothetical protein
MTTKNDGPPSAVNEGAKISGNPVCGVAALATTDGLATCDPIRDVTSQGVASSSATCGLPGSVEPMPGVSFLVEHPRATDLIRKKPSCNERRKASIAANAAFAALYSAEKN